MKKKSRASLLLSTGAWKTILLDVYRRQKIEACGALLGRVDEVGNWRVEEAHPLRNISSSPVYFEFDPAELLDLDLQQPERIVGVYHSHPQGLAVASSTDRNNMQRVNVEQQIPWVWLIVSGPFRSESATDSQDEATISLKGVVAYHHYQNSGLQQIPIQHYEEEKTNSLNDA